MYSFSSLSTFGWACGSARVVGLIWFLKMVIWVLTYVHVVIALKVHGYGITYQHIPHCKGGYMVICGYKIICMWLLNIIHGYAITYWYIPPCMGGVRLLECGYVVSWKWLCGYWTNRPWLYYYLPTYPSLQLIQATSPVSSSTQGPFSGQGQRWQSLGVPARA